MSTPQTPRTPDRPPVRPVVVTETVVVSSVPSRRIWGPLLVLGIAAVVFGVLVVANLWTSLRLVTIFAGLFLLVAGAAQLAGAIAARRYGARLIAAGVTLVAGLVVVLWPEGSLKALAIVVGVSFVVWGVASALAALKDRAGGIPGGVVFGAVLTLIGLVVIFWPGPTVALLMAFVGLSAIAFGVFAIVQALALRKAL